MFENNSILGEKPAASKQKIMVKHARKALLLGEKHALNVTSFRKKPASSRQKNILEAKSLRQKYFLLGRKKTTSLKQNRNLITLTSWPTPAIGFRRAQVMVTVKL